MQAHAEAVAALERVQILCTYLDTSSVSMAGTIGPGSAYPAEIRKAIAGGDEWVKFEAWMRSRPPGGVSPELRERLENFQHGDVVDLGNGVVLS